MAAKMTVAVRNFIQQQGSTPDRYDVAAAVYDLYLLHHDYREIDPWDFALTIWAHEMNDTAAPSSREVPAEGE